MNVKPMDATRLSGLLMLGAIAIALVMANTRFSAFYDAVHHTIVGVRVGDFNYEKPMYLWINEGLLVLFFLKIGLETKRELLVGSLSAMHGWRMPLIAAIGGMVVPAAIYVAFNFNDQEAISGWAIPAATDAVLAIGLLSLFSPKRVAPILAFLTAVAVFDDVGAIAIVGLFYGEGVDSLALLVAIALTGVLFLLGAFRINAITPYLITAALLWAALLASGLHATLAGVLLGFSLPLRGKKDRISPLYRLEYDITPVVMLTVVPAFAFFNTGLSLDGEITRSLLTPVSLGVITGLVLGKPIGIAGGAYLAAKLKIAVLPDTMDWRDIFIAAVFGGIGFTMSIFIASVAFPSLDQLNAARLSVLAASAIAGIVGAILLRLRQHPAAS